MGACERMERGAVNAGLFDKLDAARESYHYACVDLANLVRTQLQHPVEQYASALVRKMERERRARRLADAMKAVDSTREAYLGEYDALRGRSFAPEPAETC